MSPTVQEKIGSPNTAALRLPALLSDHAVVQRDRPLTLWGSGAPGRTVVIRFAEATAEGRIDDAGRFELKLPPIKAGGPHEMMIGDGVENLVVHDVLVGDVWICSGQSNMQFAFSGSLDAGADIAAAACEQIRLFACDNRGVAESGEDVSGTWKVCSSEYVAGFSAVGYYAGRELRRALNLPIGLIANAVGGTPAESWTSLEALQREPALASLAEDSQHPERPALQPHEDIGVGDLASRWMLPQTDVSDWRTMLIPQSWQSYGLQHNGAVWFRRTVDIPSDWVGQDLELSFGVADDHDRTWFNGVLVGATGPELPSCYSHPRVYKIPACLVLEGLNVLAIRVFDVWGDGGLVGRADLMHLSVAGKPTARIDLTGPWRFCVERALDQRNPVFGTRPTELYRRLVYPLRRLKPKGVFWYQGESNVNRATEYRVLFPAMIRDWRRTFGDPDLPFHFVQLANCGIRHPHPTGSPWAELREAQAEALALPHTAMATALDVGEEDIHPRNKREVGLRLARTALRHVYGRTDVLAVGPLFRGFTVSGHTVVLSFDHADGGLLCRGSTLKGFALAGSDHIFHWAEGRIMGDSIQLQSPSVPQPRAVRYGWANNPEVNLYNGAGLPAHPFRTDNWTGAAP